MQTIVTVTRGLVTAEHLQLVWTALGALGTLSFLVLIHEAHRDHEAVLRVRPTRMAVSAIATWGEVQDLGILMMALGCMALAGLLGILDVSSGALTILLLVVSELLLVVLGVLKLMRRRRLLRALRVDHKA